MDFQVVGRHAMLFDDDSTADFVNSSGALVEWCSLQIDRYDVRHLLSAPPPRTSSASSPQQKSRTSPEDPALEAQLDHERYLDLLLIPIDLVYYEVECEKPSNDGGYNVVGFSYGEREYSTDPKKADAEMEFSGLIPPFPIPGTLLQSFPPTEKVHQIIARNAMFVSKYGGQSDNSKNCDVCQHYRRRYRSHSSFTEIDYERESNEEDRDHECSKPRHHSRHSQNGDVGHLD